MVMPDLDLKNITFGRVLAAVIGTVAAVTILVGGWNTLGLPRWAWAFEMQELEAFSKETRMLLLEDQLWNAEGRLSELKRLREQLRLEGQPEPAWLSEDIAGLRRHIYQKQKSIRDLEKTD